MGCDCEFCRAHGLYNEGIDNYDAGSLGNGFDETETEKETSMSVPGDTFTTGNSVVADLPVGTVLTVVGDGELEITEVPAPEPVDVFAGSRILTHHGAATVVRQSSRLDFELNEDEILYVADSDPVVRRIYASEVTFI